MMIKITFKIFAYKWYKGGDYVFDSIKKHTHKYLTGLLKKSCKEWFDKKSVYYRPNVADGKWTFKKIQKPTTFPVFNNETPFYLIFDRKRIYNPKILGIRWIEEWQYQLENIGHTYSYQSESKLRKS